VSILLSTLLLEHTKLLRPLKSRERKDEALVSSANSKVRKLRLPNVRQLVEKSSILDVVASVFELALGEYG
jgi:hypothetical protein